MASLPEFLRFLQVSPCAGLVVKDKANTVRTVCQELTAQGIPFVSCSVSEYAQPHEVSPYLARAYTNGVWLVLDVEDDIPPWLYQQLRTLDAAGHIQDRATNQDYALAVTPARLLLLMSQSQFERSWCDAILANSGIVFRPKPD